MDSKLIVQVGKLAVLIFFNSKQIFSASFLVIEMLFKAVSQFKPDLIIVAGVHLLEFQVRSTC